MVSYGNNIVASVKEEYRELIWEYIHRFTFYHCFETPNMHWLEDRLRKEGQRVCFMAEYYLPEGTWTDLLTGETKEGGRWYQGTYDYFSMPLYVKENSILVMGREENRPDYDYSADATLRIYQPKEGAEMTAKIPDLLGNTVNTVFAVKKDGQLQITVEGCHTDLKVEIYEGNEKKEMILTADQNQVVVG